MATSTKNKRFTRRKYKVDPEKAAAKAARRERVAEEAKVLKASVEEDWEKHDTGLQPFWDMVDRIVENNGKSYSFGNSFLIFCQCHSASWLNTYPQWQTLGFQVRSGEEGIEIKAPHDKKKDEEDDPEEPGKLGFHYVSIFDISQVDPMTESELERMRAKADREAPQEKVNQDGDSE